MTESSTRRRVPLAAWFSAAGVACIWSVLFPSLVSADNPVVAPVVDQGIVLDVVPWVRVPDSSMGRPRLNSMAWSGDRVFVTEEWDGDIWEIVEGDEGPTPRRFFDVKAAIVAATSRELDNTSVTHGGLRGVAFHPDFHTNGLFYTSVMESRPESPDPSDYLSDANNPIAADSVLIEWTYDAASDQVDPLSYRQVFRVGMPVYDHPIKQISFDPFAEPGDADFGLLYIGHGDGSVQSALAGGGLNDDALGKVLRIDPRASASTAYSIPGDNPFVGDPDMIDAVWSVGHRNPHNLAFAEAAGKSVLLVAEPGRDNVEEVNIVERGGNYGWSEREGTFVHLPDGDLIDGIAPLPADDAQNGFTYPAAQLGHEGVPGSGFSGQAIAGGYVVANGSELTGQYFYSNFPISGLVYHSTLVDLVSAVTKLDPAIPERDHPDELTQASTGVVSFSFDHDRDALTPPLPKPNMSDIVDDATSYDGSGRTDVRFGQGPKGELYIMSKRNGWVYLVTNSVAPERICQGLAPTVTGLIGTPGDDVIVGTDQDDVIVGGGGDDTICGLRGNDWIDGGDGDDLIDGADGRDRLYGGQGSDIIDGGPGRDVIRGGGGPDTITGGTGSDRISGNAGADELRGENGRDRVSGNGGADVLFGGGGNDRLSGGPGTDNANGGVGIDLCVTSERSVRCER